MGYTFQFFYLLLHGHVETKMLYGKACLTGKAFQCLYLIIFYFFAGDKMIGNDNSQGMVGRIERHNHKTILLQ